MKSLLTLLLFSISFSHLSYSKGSRFSTVEFNPSVTIHKETHSSSVEIITKESYLATYNTSLYTFDPIKMDFQVINLSGIPQKHTLELVFQEHYCQEEGSDLEKPIENVKLSLSGEDIFDTYEYILAGSAVTHTLTLDIPYLPRQYAEQICYGMIGFTLKLDSL